MSEQLLAAPEHHELLTAGTEVAAERPAGTEQSPAEHAEQLERAQAAVKAAEAASERPAVAQLEPVDERPQLIDNVAKMLRMRQSLSQVQNRLRPAEKSLSKVIHQPLVRRVSESASTTVTRPSGILGGGICAFLGSLTYYWLTKSMGLAYNYFLFFVLFVGGFALGVLIEYSLHWLRRRRAA